jgi:hypothetical protein
VASAQALPDIRRSRDGDVARCVLRDNALHGLDQAIVGVPGTGFTIQTSRQIIEAMRGSLIVARTENEGVSLSIRLRAAAMHSIASG